MHLLKQGRQLACAAGVLALGALGIKIYMPCLGFLVCSNLFNLSFHVSSFNIHGQFIFIIIHSFIILGQSLFVQVCSFMVSSSLFKGKI